MKTGPRKCLVGNNEMISQMMKPKINDDKICIVEGKIVWKMENREDKDSCD